ncbi:uncharacterized protein LOC109721063 [Ananas comosus]|uniref:Uncharacterized protein LOC109721063 n=1 Tax=Ananas comosus TaxID=4615 RepID=A0A6P5G654_ANACO|nr:uncharacterized protein LOC109721063 [Ananas comosus]
MGYITEGIPRGRDRGCGRGCGGRSSGFNNKNGKGSVTGQEKKKTLLIWTNQLKASGKIKLPWKRYNRVAMGDGCVHDMHGRGTIAMSSNTTSDSNSIEDESDSEDESNCEVDKIRKFYMTATVGVAICANYYAKYLMKQNPRTSTLSGWQWVQETLRTPGESYRMLRMESEVFKRLALLLTNNYGLQSTRAMHAEEALAIFLLVCGHNETNRNIQNRFKHSGETISRKFNEVLDSLVRFSVDIIKPLDPSFTTTPPQIRNNVRFWPHFEGAIGAIDGTLIRAVIPKEDQIPYIGRKPYPMQNIMAVCDFNMVFTFVVAGWPGATHDARIFTTTLNNYGHIFPHPPEG